ncbi:MAG: molybdopterin molybdenumtransferase MoeA [Methanobrevibacter sp.]|nr:molybdopterin molybdenumtransferase MoeA [Methanobrevibacter sp.]
MGTEFLNIVESNDAKKIIESFFNQLYALESENIPVKNSYNRIAFQDIYSEIELPLFDKAIMDGYAIKAEDSFGASGNKPKVLKCIDSIGAGSNSEKTLKNGECIEISTGAPIPKGADAVVMVEYSEKIEDSNDIAIFKSLAPNINIAKKGSDIKKGELILRKGNILNPVKVGLLSAEGIENLDVFKKPKVSIISTGNELLNQSEKLKPGKIYDINTNLIKGAVLSSGGKVNIKGIVNDNYNKLKNMIEESVQESDIIICSGGTSAGVGDILKKVIDELGEIIIHGISIKPGKPTLVGRIKYKLIIGLPGNPVSAILIYYILIDLNIKAMTGSSEKNTIKRKQYKLAKRIHSAKGRMEYHLVEIKDNEIYPIIKDSGAIASLSFSDGYIKIPKFVEMIDAEEIVEVNLF